MKGAIMDPSAITNKPPNTTITAIRGIRYNFFLVLRKVQSSIKNSINLPRREYIQMEQLLTLAIRLLILQIEKWL